MSQGKQRPRNFFTASERSFQAYFTCKDPSEAVKDLIGAEFMVPLFSVSRCLALKTSLKSHQNEDWEQSDVVLVKTLSFWTKKVVIWWLFDDDLREREREAEEKRTTNSAPWCIFKKSFPMTWLKVHTHYHFTRLNPKKKGPLQFSLPALLGIYRNTKQKEFFSFSEGFLI